MNQPGHANELVHMETAYSYKSSKTNSPLKSVVQDYSLRVFIPLSPQNSPCSACPNYRQGVWSSYMSRFQCFVRCLSIVSSPKVSTVSMVTSRTLEASPQRRITSWLRRVRTHDTAVVTFYIGFCPIGYRMAEKNH